MNPSSATLPSPAELAAALQRFPYDEWIPMPDAARHVRDSGLPGQVLTSIVRRGRRRGYLLTWRTPEATYVKRVREDYAAEPS
jgi:hypothetical protein